MILLWLYLLAYLLLPVIGEIVVYITNEHIYAGEVSINLIYNHFIFVSLLIISAFFIQSYKYKHTNNKILLYSYSNIYIFNNAIIYLLFIALLIFSTSGYQFLVLGIDRGHIRTSLGVLGPIFTLFLGYIVVAMLIYVSVIYTYLSNYEKKIYRNKVLIIFILVIFISIFSGYKSAIASLMIPMFIVFYFNNLNLKKLLFFITITILLLTLFTSLVRDINLLQAFSFLIHRLTTMTAYGTIGAWNSFDEGANLNDIWINFLGIYGKNISSSLLSLEPNSLEFLKTNLSRLVTYYTYPDAQGALGGTVNVTVTCFGHAIYILGKKLYFIYAILLGIILGIFIRLFRNYVNKADAFRASLVGVWLFSIMLPIFNSGSIFMLFGLFNLIYFILTLLFMIFFRKRIKFV